MPLQVNDAFFLNNGNVTNYGQLTLSTANKQMINKGAILVSGVRGSEPRDRAIPGELGAIPDMLSTGPRVGSGVGSKRNRIWGQRPLAPPASFHPIT